MRSSAQIQKDINRALKESNGAWTGQLGALVTERMAARAAEKGGSVPRETKIMGQPHLLAYINEDERRLLKDLGGADIPGPGGIPSFPPTKEQKGQIEKQQAQKAAEREAQRDDRAPAGTYSGTGTKTVSTPAGTKTVSTSTSTPSKTVEVKSTAELRAEKEAKDAAATAAAAAAAAAKTTTPAKTTTSVTTSDRDDRAPAGTYVPAAPAPAQVTREPEPYTYTPPPPPTPAQVTREPEPYTPLPPAVDYTTTASGKPYDWEAGLSGLYVSGAEAALGPDYGVREGDFRETLRSYGEDMGVTVPSRPTSVSDSGIGTLVQSSSGVVSDPIAEALAEQRAREAAAAEAARVRAELERIDAIRRTTGVQPGLTSAAVDPFGSTPLGPIGKVMNVGYGVGQVDPALAAAVNRSKITEDQYRQAVANYQPELGLGALTASGVGLLGQLVGEAGMAATDRSIAPVGYGAGQVDPALAAAVDQRMARELGYIPSNLPESELFSTFADLAEAGDVLRSRAISNAPRAGREALSTPIWGIDEEGNLNFDMNAFLAKGASSLVPTVSGLGGAPLGYAGLAATGAGLTAGEVALEARQQAEAAALAAGYTPEQAAVIGQEAANRAAAPGAVLGGVSNVVFGPFLPAGSPVRNIIGGAAEEAFSEGIGEQTISNIAAETAMGRPFSDLPYYGVTVSPDEMTLGAAGGALLAGIGSIPPGTTTPVSPLAVAPSGPAPFIPAAPGPAPFTPGAGPAATMTVEGTATDVTPGFRPTGPTVGQIAQTPPGLLSAYQQAAESLGAAGVRNIGGAPAPGMMDVAAATEIINDLMATYGGIPTGVLQNIQDATGLSVNTIQDIVNNAPVVGTGRDELLIDEPTGAGGGGRIGVTTNPDGSVTLTNLTTGREADVARVGSEEDLATAIQVFDEATTVGSPEAITVDTAGIASLPPTDPRLNIPPGSLPAAETTPAAEPTTALVPSEPATGVATTTTPGAGTQLDVAQPVDLTATPAETAEIIEFTPTEDVIEGTAVEIAGQIPGTVETTPTTTAVTTVETTPTTTTLPPTSTVVPDDEEEIVVDVVDEGPAPGGVDEEGVEVELPPETPETDEEEEAPFECPEGYTAVKLAGRWVCQKTETSMVGRPTIGTRPYLSKVGFAGPSPRPQQFTTRTRTITAAE